MPEMTPCRRRPMFALLAKQKTEPAPEPVFLRPEPERKVGHCPKCDKYIGRGLHFHVKHCNGN